MWRMSWMKNLRRARSLDRELDEELRAYVDQLSDEYRAHGYSPEAADRAARLEAGGFEQIKEQVREARRGAWLDALWRDVAFGTRLLRRTPSFTAAATISLALGIGANSAVFGLLNALRLRSLPIADAHELAEVRLEGPRCCRHTGRNRQVSVPLWHEIQSQQQAFDELFAFSDTRFNLAPAGEVRYVEGLWVSGGFFPVLGVRPALGRMLGPEDDRAGCGTGAAVISHGLWQREYGGRPDVLSRTIQFGSGQTPIVGVMPPYFFGVEVGRSVDVAMPLCASGFGRPDHWWLAVIGRLKPGWTAAQASSHLSAIAPELLRQVVPPNYDADDARQFTTLKLSVRAASNGVSPLRRTYEDPLWLLLAIAGLVLVTACANVASLFLVRATSRQPELALRVALGASKGRVVCQLLIEGLLIAAAGTALGLAIARLAGDGVLALLSTRTDRIVLDLGLDWRLLIFGVAVIALTTIIFALAPALQAAGRARFAQATRATASRERVALRDLLVALQVAMSVVLVSAAVLFLVTLRNLASMDLGFRTHNVLVANVFMNEDRYQGKTRTARDRLSARLAAIPGIEAIADATTPPFGGISWGTIVRVKGPAGELEGDAHRNEVTAGYFRVMHTPLVAGRDFSDRDTPAMPRVSVVNETFARKYFGGASAALGRTVVDGKQDFQVIGVAASSKQYTLREEFGPIFYTAASQDPAPGLTVRYVIRSGPAAGSIKEPVRAAIGEFDPTAAVRFATLDEMAADSRLRERLMASLSGFFGVIAIVLAVVGVYGVVSFTAASRRREIGIRIALGARASHVTRTIMGRVVCVVGAGLLVGLALAIGVNARAASLLYGVEPRDPWVLTLIVGVIAVSGLIGALVPTRRALHTDPVAALRAE